MFYELSSEMCPYTKDLSSELVFRATRSSGAGGQHVNKVSTRVELRFDVVHSQLLTDGEKELIQQRLAGRLTGEGVLIVVSQEHRSQLRNKEEGTARFYKLIEWALTPRKARKSTRPTLASVRKRLEAKRRLSDKKRRRSDRFD